MTLSLSTTSNRQAWKGLIEEYRQYLPVTQKTPVVTLQEGNTPLIPVPAIAARIGRQVRVLAKYDGLNPTGSFKDRGMTMAISKAKEAGAKAVICASTGNTSAAAAAYAKRGGMRAFVLIPDGYVAIGKLAIAFSDQVLLPASNTATFAVTQGSTLSVSHTGYLAEPL